ncbi:uncharacterized protein LOC111189381 isoform X2 [Astyanax mexicanus]|uniref:uncharacterized protein LOC111189381 isoform X2 n=1 Tax=Astyanax mexicanus TaxID=7994 RepID=UPI0020CABC2C|nr:uncharacterized protein LOC111189381 isoform X2 [Astyanax mexicanus]
MKFSSMISGVLIILSIIIECIADVVPVTVKLHDSAVLPCYDRCSGLGRWTVFSRPSYPLAECNQTSCRSVKEGYQMIYNQYLQGNFSLIISDVDYSKKARYTFDCNGKDQCDVNLRIESVNISVQVKSGDSLQLDLNVSEPLEVIYNRTGEAGRSSGRICTVDGRSSDCESEYTERASVRSVLELRGMQASDSGVYTIRDARNEDAINIYSVAVQDGGDGSEALGQEHKLSRSRRSAEFNSPTCPAAGVPVWMVVVLVLLLVLLAGSVVGAEKIVNLKRRMRKFWNRSASTENQENGNTTSYPEPEQRLTEDTV